jgi:hypothetical protein
MSSGLSGLLRRVWNQDLPIYTSKTLGQELTNNGYDSCLLNSFQHTSRTDHSILSCWLQAQLHNIFSR